jgi:hypothetical protein
MCAGTAPATPPARAAFLVARLGGYLRALLVVLPLGKAAAFLGVQMGLFGSLLGGAFAPNHTGMPIVPANEKIDFLRRQVLMSRNVRGGWPANFATKSAIPRPAWSVPIGSSCGT